MGFFDILGNMESILGMPEIVQKIRCILKNEDQFTLTLQDTINHFCLSFSRLFANNPEYKNNFFDEEKIFATVKNALEEDRAVGLSDIMPESDIPEYLRVSFVEQLRKLLIISSLEYAERNHHIVTKEQLENVVYKLDHIVPTLEKIQEILFKEEDSAELSHSRYKVRNSFHYTSDSVAMYGREKEISQLKDFCGYDDNFNLTSEVAPFYWWLVYGEGGSGKSRLCFEFEKIVQAKGWTVSAQLNHDLHSLRESSKQIQNNTLFILDYTEYDLTSIMTWMNDFSNTRYQNNTIRILLLQRTAKNFKELQNSVKSGTDTFIKKTVFNNGKFLKLNPLDTSSIKKIQKEYCSRKGYRLDEPVLESLYKTFFVIDKNNFRPLYAIIIADSYLENKNSLTWDKERVLEFIC